MVVTLSSCESGMGERELEMFFCEFIAVLYAQLKELPDDFFHAEIS
jgi:hypothetical protein